MGRDGQSVIEKAGKVLECYVRGGAYALSFAQLLERTGLSRASLHRTLAELTENGFLAQLDQREEYRLGPLLRSVAVLADATSVPVVARPHMDRLRDECRETVVLAELHEEHVVPVQRADGLHEVRMNQEVGRRYPAYAGGTGKALLAHLSADERDALLASLELDALTPNTVTDLAALGESLALVARAGVAVTIGERVAEAVAIAAPVFDAHGRVVAALTISGVASRYERARLLDDAIAVKRTSEAISTEVGFHADGRDLPTADELKQPSSGARIAFDAMCDAAWNAVGSTRAPSG